MSTPTESTDRIDTPPWLANLGRYAFVGCSTFIALLCLSAWNALDLAPSSSWHPAELGVDSYSLLMLVGVQFVAAVAVTAALTDALASRTGWTSRWQRAIGYVFSASIATPGAVAVSIFYTRSIDEFVILVLVGVLFVAPFAAAGLWLLRRSVALPRRTLVIGVAAVLMVGLIVPTAIGAVVDEPDPDVAPSTGDNSSNLDGEEEIYWGDGEYGELDLNDTDANETEDSEGPYEKYETDPVPLNAVETNTSFNVSEELGYEAARTETLEGEIWVERYSWGGEEYRIDNATLPSSQFRKNGISANIVHEGFVGGPTVDPVMDDYGDWDYDFLHSTDTNETVVVIDISDDGEIVRYQAEIDLDEIREHQD